MKKMIMVVALLLALASSAVGAGAKYSALVFPSFCAGNDVMWVDTWGAAPTTVYLILRDQLSDIEDNSKSFTHPVILKLGPYQGHSMKIPLDEFCKYFDNYVGDAFSYIIEVYILDPNGLTTDVYMEGKQPERDYYVTWQWYPFYTKPIK
jgi:hypothetical protein